MVKTASSEERIEALKTEIAGLENESQSIVENAAGDGRELNEQELSRIQEILGEDKTGTHPECLLKVAYDNLRNWEQIVAGMRQREEQLSITTVENEEHAAEQVRGLRGTREFAMGANRSVIVPQDARLYSSQLEPWWGETRREREENAYAAGQWFLAHMFSQHPDAAGKPVVAKAIQWCRDHGLYAQQDTSTPGKGVELIPKPLESAIIEIREMYGVMRRDARIYPMSAKTLDIPKFVDGLSVGLVAELAAQALTEKTWSQVNLVAKKAGGYAQWSTEVGEDAIISLAADLSRDFGIAFAYREDLTGFMGDGVADFDNMGITGIVNALHANATLTLGAGNTAVTDITLADYEALLGTIANVTVMPKWYMHKSTYYASVHPLKTAAGGNTIATLTDGDPVSAGSDFRWLGYEGTFTNVLPTSTASAGTKGVVVFGDLGRGVAMGDRRGVTVQLSEHIKIIEDAVVMTANSRFDIQTHEDGQNDNSRVIAQIQLAAA